MKRLLAALLLTVGVIGVGPVRADQPDAATRTRIASADTVRLVVDQAFGYRPRNGIEIAPIPGYRLPFEAVVEEVMEYAGVRVVDADATRYGATLTITARGTAIGRLFGFTDMQYLFVGASLEGDIVFEAGGGAVWTKPFVTRKQPPLELNLNLNFERPENAPFGEIFSWAGSFVPRFLEAIGEVYGPEPLIAALDDGSRVVRPNAARALGDLGALGDGPTAGALIAVLGDRNADVRREAAWSLGKIGAKSAVTPLEALLRDRDADVRWFAAWSLAQLTDRTLDELLDSGRGAGDEGS